MFDYPCKNCKERHVSCHDVCATYLDIKNKNGIAKKKRNEDVLKIYGGKREAKKRMMTRRRTNSIGDKEFLD